MSHRRRRGRRAQLSEHRAWYVERVGEADVADAQKQAATKGAFLSNIHAVAVAHVIRRPVYIYASPADVAALGCGFYGVAFAAWPARLAAAELVSARPVAIAWQSQRHEHFVSPPPPPTVVRSFVRHLRVEGSERR